MAFRVYSNRLSTEIVSLLVGEVYMEQGHHFEAGTLSTSHDDHHHDHLSTEYVRMQLIRGRPKLRRVRASQRRSQASHDVTPCDRYDHP